MDKNDFVDFYEILELSPKANFETVERVFRYHAKKHHPDVCRVDNVDVEAEKRQFKLLVEAFETLRDPETRAAYDAVWDLQQVENKRLVEGANAAKDDCEQRTLILSMFYGQRRCDMRNPGVSVGRIEEVVGCPQEVLEFHLWYFREKGWIKREEGGLMAITAEGVDQIESRYVKPAESEVRRIEFKQDEDAQAMASQG